MHPDPIRKTSDFLKETFFSSPYLQAHPADRDYRLEHSFRVANIAKNIAEQEGLDVTNAVIAALLHDLAYCEEMHTREDWQNHGRRSAALARPFLECLGLDADSVNDICYGIAIHVDNEADFVWNRTAFSETVGDADNIDRYDVYRIYELLQHDRFSEKPLAEKKKTVEATLSRLHRLKQEKFGTSAADRLWQERLDFYIVFYEKLQAQLNCSTTVL